MMIDTAKTSDCDALQDTTGPTPGASRILAPRALQASTFLCLTSREIDIDISAFHLYSEITIGSDR